MDMWVRYDASAKQSTNVRKRFSHQQYYSSSFGSSDPHDLLTQWFNTGQALKNKDKFT